MSAALRAVRYRLWQTILNPTERNRYLLKSIISFTIRMYLTTRRTP